MKTVILHEMYEETVFVIVDGDYRHLNGVHIQNIDENDEENELYHLLYGTEYAPLANVLVLRFKQKEANLEEVRVAMLKGAYLIRTSEDA